MRSIYVSWINGFSAFTIVIAALIFCINDIFRYRKHRINLYIYGVVFYLTIAISWMGIMFSFLSTIFLGFTKPLIISMMGVLSYSTFPIGTIIINSIIWDGIGKNKNKKIVILISLIVSIFYYIILFTSFTDSIIVSNYGIEGGVYDDWPNPFSLFYIIFSVPFYTIFISCIIATIFLFKFFSGKVKLRSKVIFLSVSLIGIGNTVDTLIPGNIVFFLFPTRFLLILGLYLLSRGYKPMTS